MEQVGGTPCQLFAEARTCPSHCCCCCCRCAVPLHPPADAAMGGCGRDGSQQVREKGRGCECILVQAKLCTALLMLGALLPGSAAGSRAAAVCLTAVQQGTGCGHTQPPCYSSPSQLQHGDDSIICLCPCGGAGLAGFTSPARASQNRSVGHRHLKSTRTHLHAVALLRAPVCCCVQCLCGGQLAAAAAVPPAKAAGGAASAWQRKPQLRVCGEGSPSCGIKPWLSQWRPQHQ